MGLLKGAVRALGRSGASRAGSSDPEAVQTAWGSGAVLWGRVSSQERSWRLVFPRVRCSMRVGLWRFRFVSLEMTGSLIRGARHHPSRPVPKQGRPKGWLAHHTPSLPLPAIPCFSWRHGLLWTCVCLCLTSGPWALRHPPEPGTGPTTAPATPAPHTPAASTTVSGRQLDHTPGSGAERLCPGPARLPAMSGPSSTFPQ